MNIFTITRQCAWLFYHSNKWRVYVYLVCVWQKEQSVYVLWLCLGGFRRDEVFAESCNTMPKTPLDSPMRHQLLRQGRKRPWWRLHSRLWHWQLPSALQRKRPNTWHGNRGDQRVWLANSGAVCATESADLVRPHLTEMGALRLWRCLVITAGWCDINVLVYSILYREASISR